VEEQILQLSLQALQVPLSATGWESGQIA